MGDLDAVDALLGNPQNVTFNIIPWPHGIWTNHAQIYEKMPGKGPKVCTGADAVKLGVSEAKGPLQVRWLDVKRSAWQERQTVSGGGTLVLKTPGKGHWAVLVVPAA